MFHSFNENIVSPAQAEYSYFSADCRRVLPFSERQHFSLFKNIIALYLQIFNKLNYILFKLSGPGKFPEFQPRYSYKMHCYKKGKDKDS